MKQARHKKTNTIFHLYEVPRISNSDTKSEITRVERREAEDRELLHFNRRDLDGFLFVVET